MRQESVWMITGLIGVLVLGALYGYWIGRIGKRRCWSGKKVKGVAAYPLMVCGLVLLIASVISREASGYGDSAAVWAKFPWVVMLCAGFLAMFVAAKVAFPGVPLSELDKDNLSIR
jgi:hypothetical protein